MLAAAGATGQTIDHPYKIPRASSPVRIDGVIDDQAWQNALVIPLPFEVQPAENAPAPVATTCLLVYSETHLLVAFRADDPEPAAIQAHLSDRDKFNPRGDDYVGVQVDTFNDQRRAYSFFSNALGVQADVIRTRHSMDSSWDAIWDSAGRIDSSGYTVEIAIPFNQLRFQRLSGPQIWGLEIMRSYPRTVRRIFGAYARDRSNDCRLCQTIKIIGFEGLSPGHNIELAPTLTAARTEERPSFPEGALQEASSDVDVGLTGRWGITPNMTLSGTINPDFSQVEADSLQLDINEPFALIYPEKRPFFIEGADYFDTPVNVVHTRTMRDPRWGVKLTGKEGTSTIGAYVLHDELTNLIFPGSQGSSATSLTEKNRSSVLRYKRDIGASYTIGALVTARQGDDYSNTVYGLDGTFRLTETDSIRLQVLGSATRYPEEIAVEHGQPTGQLNDQVISFEYDHTARNAAWWLDYQDVGEDFRADLGFMPMVGYRKLRGGAAYTWIAEQDSVWSEIKIGSEHNQLVDQSGDLLNKSSSLWLSYSGALRSSLTFRGVRGQEEYRGNEFDLTSFRLNGVLWPAGSLEIALDARFGDRIDYANNRPGRRVHLNPYINYRFGKHLRLTLDHVFERMRVDDGRLYTASITQGTFVYQLNRRAFFRAIVQNVDYQRNPDLYISQVDREQRHLFNQLLLSYKINPQTLLFVGYSDNSIGSQQYDLTQLNRTFFIKLGYAWLR
jgi:hypothetical protein